MYRDIIVILLIRCADDGSGDKLRDGTGGGVLVGVHILKSYASESMGDDIDFRKADWGCFPGVRFADVKSVCDREYWGLPRGRRGGGESGVWGTGVSARSGA